MNMNHLSRVMSDKPNSKYRDKYTQQIFTVDELNEAILKPTIALGIKEVEQLTDWFERFEKI